MTPPISRREFIRDCAVCGLGAAAACSWAADALGAPPKAPAKSGAAAATEALHEAMFWEPADNGRVRCLTCPNLCEREDGGVTLCHTRVNKGGKLYTLTYGKPCIICKDPLAKNPLYHVDPGAEAVGVATAGCNLICKYCQNWDISQVGPEKTKNMAVSPDELVAKVKERQLKWLTFSYTEPVAYFEYAVDAAKLAKKNGVNVAVVTAGFVSAKPLQALMDYADAFSVTLKGYTKEFYKDVCGCGMEDVWKSVQAIYQGKKWIEVVTLVVPGMNDAEDGLTSIARSLAKIGKEIPLHFLRFAPAYKLAQLQPTPVATLEKARTLALKEGLKHVYLDLPAHEGANTYCPTCNKMVIERAGFTVLKNNLRNGRCPQCSTRLAGIFSGALSPQRVPADRETSAAST